MYFLFVLVICLLSLSTLFKEKWCTHRKWSTKSGCNPSFRLSIILLLADDVSINPGPKTFQNMCFATTNVRSVCHKSAALSDLILSKHIDILALTETWLLASDTSACLADICPNGFCLYHHPVVQVGVVESHSLYLKYIK